VSEIVLRVKRAPALRVDLRGVLPQRLATLSRPQIERLTVWHGNEPLALAELFDVGMRDEAGATLRFEGDLARFDRIGAALDGGRLEVAGSVGDYVGLQMRAGSIRVAGGAGLFAGGEMAGGELTIAGDAGDFAAAALPGSMEGMRGGRLVIGGNAGERLGDRMRRGWIAVHGDAGAFAGARMIAGTIAIGGAVGTHPAFGMRRGTLLLARAQPVLAPTFVATAHDFSAFWQLLARELAALGAPFDALAARTPARWVGDLGVDGLGEVLLAA
jgi:formylmethanofuran dehydrogenase subunit C